jgi:hypothetical protein
MTKLAISMRVELVSLPSNLVVRWELAMLMFYGRTIDRRTYARLFQLNHPDHGAGGQPDDRPGALLEPGQTEPADALCPGDPGD